ncbi:MAG: hypothetical protein A2X99_01835 [Deltaproteobacteria bacterium GWB2_55_19]|nr:MAG: hypothetical protein A2X99_01835 [Deltaproteobacteria bacterium GWB2_55_19]HAO92575.1 hypothetical protein [Deltaproteobacteria bacterium]
MLNTFRFLLLISMAVWVGMLIFFTFFITPSIFKVLPRELAGELVGVIFPKYWMVGYAAGALSLLSIIAISLIEKSFPTAVLSLVALMTALTFYSGLVVGAKAKTMSAEIRNIQDPVKKEEMRASFKKVHAESAAINLAIMAGGVTVIFFISRNLRL